MYTYAQFHTLLLISIICLIPASLTLFPWIHGPAILSLPPGVTNRTMGWGGDPCSLHFFGWFIALADPELDLLTGGRSSVQVCVMGSRPPDMGGCFHTTLWLLVDCISVSHAYIYLACRSSKAHAELQIEHSLGTGSWGTSWSLTMR